MACQCERWIVHDTGRNCHGPTEATSFAYAMKGIREPAVAGLFYPGEKALLRDQVRGFLDASHAPSPSPVKALIAPHAGYVYSGPVAGSAFATLLDRPLATERVVLIGPAHTVALSGLAVPRATAFRTPLGDVPVDRGAVDSLARLPNVARADAPHRREHALEVELPFLQEALGAFTLVPVVVGDADPTEVARALDALWGGMETLVVVSSDLSHYLPYEEAGHLDERTARAIVELRPEEIGPEQACGRIPIQGLLAVARERGLSAACLDLRSSGDTAGDRARVVGYGAFAFA